jgi:DNA mismatch repair protein MSH2
MISGEHLTKFEELLEAAVDLERIPEEYLICATWGYRCRWPWP